MKRIHRKAQHSLVLAPKVLNPIWRPWRRVSPKLRPHFRCSFGSTVHLSKIRRTLGPPTKRVNLHIRYVACPPRVPYSTSCIRPVKGRNAKNVRFFKFFWPPGDTPKRASNPALFAFLHSLQPLYERVCNPPLPPILPRIRLERRKEGRNPVPAFFPSTLPTFISLPLPPARPPIWGSCQPPLLA